MRGTLIKSGVLWVDPESGEIVESLVEFLEALPEGTKLKIIVCDMLDDADDLDGEDDDG